METNKSELYVKCTSLNARNRCNENTEVSDFIPDKCFLPFQAHALARVQPQTQCTITPAAREEKSTMKQKGKRRFGIPRKNTGRH